MLLPWPIRPKRLWRCRQQPGKPASPFGAGICTLAPIHLSHKLLVCCMLALLLLALGTTRGSVASAYALLQADAAGIAPAHLRAGAGVRSGPGDRYLLLAVAPEVKIIPFSAAAATASGCALTFRGQPAWVAAAQADPRHGCARRTRWGEQL